MVVKRKKPVPVRPMLSEVAMRVQATMGGAPWTSGMLSPLLELPIAIIDQALTELYDRGDLHQTRRDGRTFWSRHERVGRPENYSKGVA